MVTLTNLSLFSGIGGMDLAAKWLGIKTVAYVECDPYAQMVLLSRMRSGDLDDAPIFEDVRTFRGTSLRGSIDIVSGGFPCQPHSQCGKNKRERDERNLWPEYLRIVRECRPSFVLGENVYGIWSNGYAIKVMADLEEIGYCCVPVLSTTCEVGGPFTRKRVFFVAHSMCLRRNLYKEKSEKRINPKVFKPWKAVAPMVSLDLGRYGHFSIPNLSRMVNGIPRKLDELRLYGNAVVPQCATEVWKKIIILSDENRMNEKY